MNDTVNKFPFIYYAKDSNGEKISIPFIDLEEGEDDPNVLFIALSRRSAKSKSERVIPGSTSRISMFVNIDTLKKHLEPEVVEKVKAALAKAHEEEN